MEEVLLWIVRSDFIKYVNYFFAGFIGSLGGILKISYESKKTIGFYKLFQKTISNGIIGGFAGMFMTYFSNNEAFNFSIAGLSGALGFKETIDLIINFIKGGIKNGKDF